MIIPCHPQDCLCGQCGAERPVIGYEKSEELVCDPATFWVRVNLREKRGSHCVAEQGVATAPAPAKIVPKSKLSNEFIIEALAKKFQQHQPVYRQCAVLSENHGIDLSRAALTSAILAAGDCSERWSGRRPTNCATPPICKPMKPRCRCRRVKNPDATTKPICGNTAGPPARSSLTFKWSRGRGARPRSSREFGGILQCDGYAAYDKLGEGIHFAGCLAHARRGFVEANKLAPQNPLPVEIVDTIGRLYEVEEKARQAGLGAAERLALRQEHSAPVMEALKLRLVEIRGQNPPGGELAEACDYTPEPMEPSGGLLEKRRGGNRQQLV